jgi:hypothetical protein
MTQAKHRALLMSALLVGTAGAALTANAQTATSLNPSFLTGPSTTVAPNTAGPSTTVAPNTAGPSIVVVPNPGTSVNSSRTVLPNTNPNTVTPGGAVSPNAVVPGGTVSPNAVVPGGTVSPNSVQSPNVTGQTQPIIVPNGASTTGGATGVGTGGAGGVGSGTSGTGAAGGGASTN